jgi:uncharacterized protein (DUF488 family)
MPDEIAEVLTIGHSNHATDTFLGLLRAAAVTAIADVRSIPFSRRHPQFDRERLAADLGREGIAYVHLGVQLGGRPADPLLWRDGVADFERIAATPAFREGLDRVVAGAQIHRLALMCSERDPLHCHRCLLIGRALVARGVGVGHLLADGTTRSQADIEADLLALAGLDDAQADLLLAPEERLALAYRDHVRRLYRAGGVTRRL